MDSSSANPYVLEQYGPLFLTILTIIVAATFVMWLAVFLLNQFLDTSREGHRERRGSLAKQLTFGISLFVLLVLLGLWNAWVYYQPYAPGEVIATPSPVVESQPLLPYVLTLFIVIVALAFVAWLVVFLSGLTAGLSLRGYDERRSYLLRNAGFAVVTLCVLAILIVLRVGAAQASLQPDSAQKLPVHVENQ